MEPIRHLGNVGINVDAVRAKQDEIITRLNKLTELMNKKKLTLDEYMEKIPPKRFKAEDIELWSLPHANECHLTFINKEEAEAALKLLTNNTN